MAWYSTDGFHFLSVKSQGKVQLPTQESIMNTIEASVKLSATPPALREMRKTVTSVFFTAGELRVKGSCASKLTEMLDGRVSLLGGHTTFQAADLIC